MLSRTAENLYWSARYMERAETIARLLEVGYRMSMMPSQSGGHATEWASVLSASGASEGFHAHFEEPNKDNVETFLFFHPENPSSIRNCIRAARSNLRAVRTAITSEVWDSVNQSYLGLRDMERANIPNNLSQMCDWTKRQTATVRGAFINTQLQQDGYDFFNLGTYVERADNTARILDVKYYVLLPTIGMIGGEVDTYQWTTLLRALSAYRAFHWAYGGDFAREKVAHFLILNVTCPRSLLHCQDKVAHHLTRLSQAYGQVAPADGVQQEFLDELRNTSIDTIVQNGLHEFLTGFIAQNARVGEEIADAYLFGGG